MHASTMNHCDGFKAEAAAAAHEACFVVVCAAIDQGLILVFMQTVTCKISISFPYLNIEYL